MSYNCGCNCGCNYNDCGCQTSTCPSCITVLTTTTTTIPCDGSICDVSIDSNCVLNNNNNLVCYGINKGDNLNIVISKLITKFSSIVCPSTTTTTTIPCTNCTAHDVTIGNQIWAGCNLDVTTYRNGDTIPQVTDPTAWANLTTGAWCYYNNDSANGPIYGKLYNWYALTDSRGIGPTGYHVPAIGEWNTLINFAGGDSSAATELKEAGLCHWNSPNTAATNNTGFTALPSGVRSTVFEQKNNVTNFWTSTSVGSTTATSISLWYNDTSILRYTGQKYYGYSVRLIKN